MTVDFSCCSDNLDSSSILENSLNAKEKLISELNMELHNIEITLANEREEHMNDIKKLTAVLNEKVSESQTLSSRVMLFETQNRMIVLPLGGFR